MTQEQKAKSYDKALEKIHRFIDGYSRREISKEELEDIFPELKETEDERIKKSLIDYLGGFKSSDMWNESFSFGDVVSWIEKQGEQKSVDKSEPKFKVGDWIVSKTSNLVYRVDSILTPQSKCYYLSHNGGIVLVSFTDEQNYRLWTIKDAKDGDVLADEYGIYIFNNFDSLDDKLFICKCAYEYSKKVLEIGGMLCSKTDVYPASKEQCDLLYQKIKEAGYKWDPEKKELSKCICFTKTMTSEKVSPAWSEEDDIYIENIILAVEKQYPTAAKDIVNWLKSLKNRINNFYA